MKIAKTLALWLMRAVATLLLVVALAIVFTALSPVYNFPESRPFAGKDIYNPYEGVDSTTEWHRANFHTHTRVEGIFNECDYAPEETVREYMKYGYDIVTISNHNEITPFSTLEDEAVSIYEHGYNIFKSHNLVFGAESELNYDMVMPFTASQRQFMLNLLRADADMVQLNHPLRSRATTDEHMRLLEGYELVELDSGRSIENEYWDAALTAGHYILGTANDDLHYPDRSACIAVRSNFLATPALTYDAVVATLRRGAFYAMRTPDYGAGDWQEKVVRNATIPAISNIGLSDDVVYIALTEAADSIKFTGSDHRTLHLATACDSAAMALAAEEPYVRITAYFADGEVIYTNPFARYDSDVANSPRREVSHTVNWLYTVLLNLALLAVAVGLVILYVKLIKRR